MAFALGGFSLLAYRSSLAWFFFGKAPWADLLHRALLIIAGGLMVIWRTRAR
ncbi:MAG: hypothetical protein OIF47_09815 [Marinibacterium sp.]|nr:hypothetical protein [Marinibacterium sp.]